MAVGTLAGSRMGGIVARRLGARAVVRLGIPAFGAALCLAALAGDLAVLTAALFGFGVIAGVVDVAMNAEAVVVERRHGRPLMSGFHGLWSAGLLAGALVGVGAAAAGVRPPVQFAIVALAVAGATAPLLDRLPRRDLMPQDRPEVARGWSVAVVLLGLIAFCAFFAEGSAADWSAVYLRDRAGAGPAVAAAGFACFSLGMMGMRFLGDGLAAAFGPVRLVLCSTATAAAGLSLALLVPSAATGVVGFGLLGIGLGPVVPTAVSAAAGAGLGIVEDTVSRVFTLGYVGAVSGPALIGFASSQVGLRAALVIPVCLVIAITMSAPRLGTAAGARPG